jgi:hypothetical protein
MELSLVVFCLGFLVEYYQRTWLEAHIPAFIEAQQAKTTSGFLNDTHQKWGEIWPLEELTEDEVQSAKGDVECT